MCGLNEQVCVYIGDLLEDREAGHHPFVYGYSDTFPLVVSVELERQGLMTRAEYRDAAIAERRENYAEPLNPFNHKRTKEYVAGMVEDLPYDCYTSHEEQRSWRSVQLAVKARHEAFLDAFQRLEFTSSSMARYRAELALLRERFPQEFTELEGVSQTLHSLFLAPANESKSEKQRRKRLRGQYANERRSLVSKLEHKAAPILADYSSSLLGPKQSPERLAA